MTINWSFIQVIVTCFGSKILLIFCLNLKLTIWITKVFTKITRVTRCSTEIFNCYSYIVKNLYKKFSWIRLNERKCHFFLVFLQCVAVLNSAEVVQSILALRRLVYGLVANFLIDITSIFSFLEANMIMSFSDI